MIIQKTRRKAIIQGVDQRSISVHFFLQDYADGHTGRELILDVLNAKGEFLSLEEVKTKEFVLVNKEQILCVELEERDLIEGTLFTREIPVELELSGGLSFEGRFPVELPPERSRLSDHLNYTPRFLYLIREGADLIVNKFYILSLKEKAVNHID